MKIIQINAVYGHGSTGTIVRDIEQLCEQNGIECYVASPDPKVREAKRGYVIGNALDHKLHALLCRINGKQAYFSHIPTWNLCRHISRIKPDVVHLHNLHSNYIHLNILLKYLAKTDIRTVITLHDCWFYTGGCTHYTCLKCNRWQQSCGKCPSKYKKLLDSSHCIIKDKIKHFQNKSNIIVIGVSDWIRKESIKNVFHGCLNYTVYNGIDLSVFHPTPSNLRERLGLNGKYVIIGPASKWLEPIRRQHLLDFVSRLRDNEVLLLFGCRNAKINVPKGIYLYGFTQSREELAQLYSMADVFANCSYEESFSLINIECQACGTPAVIFDNTGMTETVDGVSGYKVKTGDYIGLLEACRKLSSIENDEQYDKRLRFVRNNFDKNNNYLRLIEIYRTIKE